MQTYDPIRQPYPSHIPAMRPTHEGSAGQSLTPIFDALYLEYRRSFRALPGDRTGEENLVFHGFAGHPGSRLAVHPPYGATAWQPYPVRQHPALPPAPGGR
ncbi:hypothetical protein [Streptomyces sp. NPDC047315]|uniref:hypothetical protein n=1 Tax=Streptomyces sp. NPDC047315 TaxID=3155142 RepID=UPI0033DEF6B7